MPLDFATPPNQYWIQIFTVLCSLATVVTIIGLLGSTVLCPLIAKILFRGKKRGLVPAENPNPPSSIALLIPAHNDSDKLDKTLASIVSAISYLKASGYSITVSVHVCLDHCSDNSLEIAYRYPCLICFNFNAPGKWNAIGTLIQQSRADWTALVDAGTIWDRDFLLKIVSRISPKHVAIAPGYSNPDAGLFERLNWRLEQWLKSIEMEAGGPISLHGATVFYRYEALCQALATLPAKSWLNDDVVIPLTIRRLNPDSTVLYLSNSIVKDSTEKISTDSSQYPRRVRMMIGNVEWIKGLLPNILKENLIVGMLAGRRVFRMLWSYWVISAILAATLLFGSVSVELGFTLVVTLGILFFIPQLKSIRHAFLASLLSAYYLMLPSTSLGLDGGKRWR